MCVHWARWIDEGFVKFLNQKKWTVEHVELARCGSAHRVNSARERRLAREAAFQRAGSKL